MIDLRPATDELARVVAGVREEQLTGITPCADLSVAELLDHIDGLSQAFTAGAQKRVLDGGPAGPAADANRLGPDWRARIPHRLGTLGEAWQDPSAWTGTSTVGGVESPGEANGLFAADEVVVHGWDLAVATEQQFEVDPDLLEAVVEFVGQIVGHSPEGTPGLFGAPVTVSDDAAPLARLVALTGRDPAWRPTP